MTNRDSTQTTTTTRQPTTTTSASASPSPSRPTTEEDQEAPLVPFIQQPAERDEMADIRRELTALRSQLNRIEQTMQETTDSQ